MITILKRITIVALLFGCLQTMMPASTKEKKNEDNTALTSTLCVAGALGVGAGCYALWQHFTHQDPAADHMSVNVLSLARWREVSLIPFKHAWWTEADMTHDLDGVKKCLVKDLKHKYLVDAHNNPITNVEDLDFALTNEINALQETKSVTILSSTYNTIKSWFASPEESKVEKKQKKAVDRLLGRLKTLQKITGELKKV